MGPFPTDTLGLPPHLGAVGVEVGARGGGVRKKTPLNSGEGHRELA